MVDNKRTDYNENQRNIQHQYEMDKNGVKCCDNSLIAIAKPIENVNDYKNIYKCYSSIFGFRHFIKRFCQIIVDIAVTFEASTLLQINKYLGDFLDLVSEDFANKESYAFYYINRIAELRAEIACAKIIKRTVLNENENVDSLNHAICPKKNRNIEQPGETTNDSMLCTNFEQFDPDDKYGKVKDDETTSSAEEYTPIEKKDKIHDDEKTGDGTDKEESSCLQWLMHLNLKMKQKETTCVYFVENQNTAIGQVEIFRDEKIRLSTFSNIHSRFKQWAIQLAAEGFVHIRIKERNQEGIQCYFCDVFYPIDVENVVHKPDCRMKEGIARDNIPYRTEKKFFTVFSQLQPAKTNQGTKNETRDVETDAAPGVLQVTSKETGEYNSRLRNTNVSKPKVNASASHFTRAREAEHASISSIKRPVMCEDQAASSIIVVSSHDYITTSRANRNLSNNGSASSSTHANSNTLHSSQPTEITSSNTVTQNPTQPRNISSGTQQPTPATQTPPQRLPTTSVSTLHADTMIAATPAPSQPISTNNRPQQNQTQTRPNVTNLSNEANQLALAQVSQTQPTGTNHAQQEPAANRPAGRRPGHTPTYSELGIITERPKRNDYALKIKRLESFESWPRGHHLTPSELADAGFYYAGYGDCARCFYCGGGLRNWEDEDDVWVEHARWFPKCAFIRQQMGQIFVDTVKGLNEDRDQITYDMVMDKMRDAGHTFNLENKESPLIKDPAVRTVVDMGYTLEDALQVALLVKEEGSIMSSDTLLEKLERENKKRETTARTQMAIASAHSEIDAQLALPSGNQTEKSSSGARQLALTNGDEGMQVALIDQPGGQVAAIDVLPNVERILEMIRAIKESNNQLRQQTVCKICMDKEVAVVFLPCGHLVSCGDCAVAMRDCPVCRVNVKGIVRAFIA